MRVLVAKVREVPGFAAYRLSYDGILESRWRWGAYYSGIERNDIWRIVPLKNNAKGYIPISLRSADGKCRRTHLHRILAETFISPAPFEKAVVRHLNGDSTDNSLDNLAWGTYLDNENDKKLYGQWHKRTGGAKLTSDQVTKIRERAFKISQKSLAVEYGVSRPTITRIINGSIWREV